MLIKQIPFNNLSEYYDRYSIIIKYDTEYAVIKKIGDKVVDVQTNVPITLSRLIASKVDVSCYVIVEGEIPNVLQCRDYIEHLYHNANITPFMIKSNDQLKTAFHM